MTAPAAPGGGWPTGSWRDADVADTAALRRLVSDFRLAPAAARVLAVRGVVDPARVASFLRPALSSCLLPDALPGIHEAAAIIGRHAGAGGEIVVFGDFDADGMTAATILRSALLAIGAKASVFIPDRIHEGYGFTEAALERCLAEHPGAKLIVTVDCGISHAPACDRAVARGIEVVVTDHHEVGLDVPKTASALVNPCLPGTPEPLRHLCGAGVAFKLAHELARRFLDASRGPRLMRPLTAIAAVGTIGDLVPLVGENRIIASRGLAILNARSDPELAGLRALCNLAGVRGDLDSATLAFTIVPRINAAGRVGNPQVALDLLAASDAAAAIPLARRLGQFNDLRRAEEAAAVKAAEASIAASGSDAPALVLHDDAWHPGVIGLVASRLSNRRHLPSIVFTADDEPGLLRGSARCPEIPGLDLMQLLDRCRDMLSSFGGHRAAAGLTLAASRLGEFRERFADICAEAEAGLDMRPVRLVEAWITPEDATEALARDISRIGPFGTLNPPPLLGMRGLRLDSDPATFGRAAGSNWRLSFAETTIRGMVFGRRDMPFRAADRVDVVFNFTRDMYGALQFAIRDIRPA